MGDYVIKSTTPTQPDVYSISSSKQVLVTKDPVFVRKDVLNGRYIGRKPENYMLVAMVLCVFNPLFGPVALFFAIMSDRAYTAGDIRYAEKWAQYSMTACMLVFISSVILYIAVAFTLSPIGVNGGHSLGM